MSVCAKDGNLFILVLQAKHVSGHRKDAFCKIYVDKQRFFKTQTVDKTTDPKWEEQARQLSMSKDKSVTTLRFAIYHDRTFLWDSFLGEVSFNIDELSDGVPRDDWFPLKKKGGSEAQGELHLQLLFLEPGDTMSEKYDEFPYPLQTLMRKKRFTQFSKALTTLKPEYLEAKDRDGNRPLHVACLLDLPDCVTQLIDKGADPKGTDANGEVQIIHKAAGFCSKAITTLLDKGVDIKAKDKEGRAPIHHAAVENNVKSLTILLEKGAEINAVDNEGHTALHRALLEKECADSIKFLVEKGIDIRLADKSGVACTQLCADRKVSDKMKKAFLRACGVIDEREFPIIPNLSKKKYIEGNHLAMEWKDNLQFAISTKPGVSKISVLMHYDFEDRTIKPMEKIGFLVIKTTQGAYREPSYQQDFIGYGTADPFEIKIDDDKKDSANFFCLMPYAKTPDVTGYFDMIVYADGDFELTELVAWKNSASSTGEWSAQQSGGSQEFDTWLNNPKFALTLPKGQEKIKACVLLSQQKAALDLIPYQVTPYQFYIGYYILDHELFDVKHQYPRWKNAQEIFLHIEFDTTKENEYVIIPTTHKPNELTSFTLTVFCDQEVKVEKK